MGLFGNFKSGSTMLENPNAPVSANDFLHIMGWVTFHPLLASR